MQPSGLILLFLGLLAGSLGPLLGVALGALIAHRLGKGQSPLPPVRAARKVEVAADEPAKEPEGPRRPVLRA